MCADHPLVGRAPRNAAATGTAPTLERCLSIPRQFSPRLTPDPVLLFPLLRVEARIGAPAMSRSFWILRAGSERRGQPATCHCTEAWMSGQPGRGTASAGNGQGKIDQMAALLKILHASVRHTRRILWLCLAASEILPRLLRDRPPVAHGFRSRESRFSWLAVVTPTLPPYHKDGNPLVQSQGRTSVRFLLRPPTPIHLCFQLGNQFGRVSAEMRGSTTVGVVPSSSSAEPSSGNSWRYVPTNASSEGGSTPRSR